LGGFSDSEKPYSNRLCSRNIESAFTLFWVDASAWGTRLRSAIESLLDQIKVKRFTVNAKGRRIQLTTHARLTLLAKNASKHASTADTLLAIKWIGNEGSHAGSLTRDDVLDGFDLLDHALDQVFNTRAVERAKLAAAEEMALRMTIHSRTSPTL
jgi:hypothetical protein